MWCHVFKLSAENKSICDIKNEQHEENHVQNYPWLYIRLKNICENKQEKALEQNVISI